MKKFVLLLSILFLVGCARVPAKPIIPIAVPMTSPSGPGFYHTVQKGQTFYRIAKLYNTDAKELMRVNRAEDPRSLEIGQKLFIPSGQGTLPSYQMKGFEPVTRQAIERLVRLNRAPTQWKTITVHHSGTLQGGAKVFHKDHSRRMGGLFYHFVLGNGSYSDDGEIELGWRWKKQVKAKRAYDIQICLVGDFNKQEVSQHQFDSLLMLADVLRKEYKIPLSHVRRHEDVKGKPTECPGKHFPFGEFISRLSKM